MAIQAGENIAAADFVDSSAGAGDAGKGVKLDAAGAIDHSMIPDPVPSDLGTPTLDNLYTNNSGRTQIHIVSASRTGGITNFFIGYVDGAIVSYDFLDISAAATVGMTAIMVVPAGSTYKVDSSGTPSDWTVRAWKIITMP